MKPCVDMHVDTLNKQLGSLSFVVVPTNRLDLMPLYVRFFNSGVGSNLQDHLEVYVQQKCTQPITLYKAQKPLQMVKIGLQWLTMFTGNTHAPK